MAEAKKKESTTKKTTVKEVKPSTKKTTKKETKPVEKKTTKKVEAIKEVKKVTKKAEPFKETKKTTKKEVKPVEKKTETKKVEVKKAVPKKVEETKEVKKATVKKTAPKKEVKPVKEEVKKEVVEEVVEQPVEVEEKYYTQSIKTVNTDSDDNKIVLVLLLVMLFVFIAGVVYIFDYTRKNTNNSETNSSVNTKVEHVYSSDGKKPTTNSDQKENYENIEKISVTKYKELLDSEEKMVVLVASKYCSHCNAFEPTLNKVAGELRKRVYKIDIAELANKEEADLFESMFEITGTPTTLIVDKTQVVASVSGNLEEEIIKNWINENY